MRFKPNKSPISSRPLGSSRSQKVQVPLSIKNGKGGGDPEKTPFLGDDGGAGPRLSMGCLPSVLLFYTPVHYVVHNGMLKSIV